MDDIHDIYGWWEIPFLLWKNPYFILGLSLLAFVLIALCYIFYQRKKAKLPILPRETPLTPYESAIKELEAARLLICPGRDKEIAIALCSIIRRYLEKDFDLSFPEKTTEEFLHTMNQHHTLDSHAVIELTQFLKLCDLAKFAKQHFTPSEQEKIYNLALSFLTAANAQKINTIPQTNPQPASAAI